MLTPTTYLSIKYQATIERKIIRCNRILAETASFVSEQRKFEAGILWKEDVPDLPRNMIGAEGWLKNTLRRLRRNPKLATIVEEDIEQTVKLGFTLGRGDTHRVENSTGWPFVGVTLAPVSAPA